MGKIKRYWKNAVLILVVLIMMVLLFMWYSRENEQRIEMQNLNYAMDSARQTASRIDGEFTNAVQRIRTYSYVVNEIPDASEVSAELLKNLEKSTIFDALLYVSPEGSILTSDGSVYSGDYDFIEKGLNGESGSEIVAETEYSDEMMVVFYAPLEEDGGVRGLLLGLYRASEYLRSMLTTTYFGETADVFLCAADGKAIARGHGELPQDPLPEYMLENGTIDEKTAEEMWKVFKGQINESSFICRTDERGRSTDNICVTNIENNSFVLVQTFPLKVTQEMLNNANSAGMRLQVSLIVLFMLYILFLVLQSEHERRRLKRENTEKGYVTDGTTALFNRFVLVDIKENSYRYLLGSTPLDKNFPTSGKYENYVDYLCSDIENKEDIEKFSSCFRREAVVEELAGGVLDTQYEYRIRVGGATRWEHMNLVCLERDGGGNATKVLFVRQDVTRLVEREVKARAEIAVANRRERQYIAATMSDAMFTYEINLTHDTIDEITYKQGARETGVMDLIGMNPPCAASEWFEAWKPYIDEESLEEYSKNVSVESLLKHFEEGKRELVVEYWRTTTDGKKICVRQSFFMTTDDETKDVMAMAISKEITEQVQKQREQMHALHDALMQAQHANKSKTTFLNNMSHDIRTPMNAIIGFTTIALNHIENTDMVLDSLQKVLSSSNHLLSLINDILDMSRIESGKVQIKEQECNISEIIHNVVNIIQPQVKAKQLDLFIDTFDVSDEDIIADPLKLSQVFVNLASNAVKYTPAGGTVSFKIIEESKSDNRGNYTFIIKDNGIGMTPEFVEHIFEPFERESSVTKTGIQGTGLGMAITKKIVEMMGGSITVNSEKNKGSEFIVKFSLKLQSGKKKSMSIEELAGMRAMVVDDDPDNCDSVTKMLKQLGMRAEWTTSGKEAVYRAKNANSEGDPYSTYILDWQMPEMSGIEIVRKIRKSIGEASPIIILTAYDWSDIEQEAKEAGVNAFCAKPLFLSDLQNALLSAHSIGEEKTEEDSPEEIDFSGKRVLLVEDNELNREIAEMLLSEMGFTVETAPDGTDAVAMMQNAEENYYDAILMDVQMPVMDGYEATRTIRAMSRQDVKTLPIIAMTANAMEEDKKNALTSGMNAHVAKPIETNLLVAALSKYLNNNN